MKAYGLLNSTEKPTAVKNIFSWINMSGFETGAIFHRVYIFEQQVYLFTFLISKVRTEPKKILLGD